MIYGLAIFILEKKLIELNLKRTAIDLLVQSGFYIIDIFPCKKNNNLSKIKNLNEPALILVTFDFLPITTTKKQSLLYEVIDNYRLLTKHKINNLLCRDKFIFQDFELIKSTINSQDAWDFLKVNRPESINNYKNTIYKLSTTLITTYPIRRDITSYHRRRSKLEIIEYKGNLAVKKTFRPGCENFLERELFILKKFSYLIEIPKLIEYGASYFISPYYENIFDFNPQSNSIPLDIVRQAMRLLNLFYESGYALIDFHPGNIIIDKKQGFKMVDFEFLYRYKNKPEVFKNCYDLAGVPENFEGDRPLRSLRKEDIFLARSYDRDWKPYINLELDELLKLI